MFLLGKSNVNRPRAIMEKKKTNGWILWLIRWSMHNLITNSNVVFDDKPFRSSNIYISATIFSKPARNNFLLFYTCTLEHIAHRIATIIFLIDLYFIFNLLKICWAVSDIVHKLLKTYDNGTHHFRKSESLWIPWSSIYSVVTKCLFKLPNCYQTWNILLHLYSLCYLVRVNI